MCVCVCVCVCVNVMYVDLPACVCVGGGGKELYDHGCECNQLRVYIYGCIRVSLCGCVFASVGARTHDKFKVLFAASGIVPDSDRAPLV